MMIRKLLTISGTSPASASTAVLGTLSGLDKYEWFTIDAALVGATGGTLDVYLQRQIARDAEISGGIWVDWAHYTQLAGSGAAVRWQAQTGPGIAIALAAAVPVTVATDASPGTPALAANSFVGGHPGQAVRAVCVAGSGTSAGAALAIYFTCFSRQ